MDHGQKHLKRLTSVIIADTETFYLEESEDCQIQILLLCAINENTCGKGSVLFSMGAAVGDVNISTGNCKH